MDLLPIPEIIKESPLYAAIAVCITLIITIILNSVLLSLVRVPSRLDTRKGRTYISVVRNSISVVLFGLAFYIIFQLLNINVMPLLASAGILGLTLGIGARSLIEDLIAGFFILSQDSIAIGDHVLIGNTFEGVVEDVGFRTVTLRALNGAVNIIPNGQAKQVMNFSRGKAVLLLDIPIKAGQNTDEIIKVMNKVVASMRDENDNLYRITPESEVYGIQGITGGGTIQIRVTITTTASNRLLVEKEYRYRLLKAFEKKKIQLA